MNINFTKKELQIIVESVDNELDNHYLHLIDQSEEVKILYKIINKIAKQLRIKR